MANAFRFLLVATLYGGVFAGIASAQSQNIVREIADYERQIQQNRELITAKEARVFQINDEILKGQATLDEMERRLRPLNTTLEALRAEHQKTKGLFEMALANPEIADTSKLDTLRREHQSSKAKLDTIAEEVLVAGKDVEARRKAMSDLQNQKRASEMDLEILNRGTRSLLLKKPVIVEAAGECLMHEDITIRSCKETALLKAKQDAVEKGGVSIVRSLTEVTLHDVKRDDIRVETTGKIRELEVLKPPSYAAEGEYGKWTVTIRAVVQSQADIGSRVTGEVSSPQATPQARATKPLDRASQPLVHSGLQLTPTSSFNLAYADYLNGNYAQATSGFQRFVKTFPGTSLTPNAHYWLGESYYQQKDYTRAIQSFEYVSVEFPGNEKVPGALYKIGLAWLELGDLVKARKHIKRVIEEFPWSDEAKLAKNKLAEIHY